MNKQTFFVALWPHLTLVVYLHFVRIRQDILLNRKIDITTPLLIYRVLYELSCIKFNMYFSGKSNKKLCLRAEKYLYSAHHSKPVDYFFDY